MTHHIEMQTKVCITKNVRNNMYTKTEKIAMADGREIIVGNIPYHVKDGILYVGMTTDGGYDYVPMGRVKEGEEKV